NHYSNLVEKVLGVSYRDTHGAGAAGGLGFACLTIGAQLVSGAEFIAEAIHLEEAIERADLVITGEGQSDEQTLYGKAPGYVASLANQYHVPVVLLSGSLTGDFDLLRDHFSGCFSIINEPLSLKNCMENAEMLVEEQMKQITHFVRNFKK